MSSTYGPIADVFERFAYSPIESAAEERATIIAAKGGDRKAVTRLMIAYGAALRAGVTPFIRATDRPQPADLQEIRGASVAGFFEAIDAFDPEGPNDRLAGIVANYIAHEVSAAMGSGTGTGLSIADRTRRRYWSILRKADGNVAAAEALAPSEGMSVEVFRQIRQAIDAKSWDGMISESEGDRPHATESGATVIGGSTDSDGTGAFQHAEDKINAAAAISALEDEFQVEVIRYAYGFVTGEQMSDAEISEAMPGGYSRATINRARNKAIIAMRLAMGA